MGKKKSRGRPKAEQPQLFRTIRTTDEEWASYQAAADADGVTRSAWIRQALNKAAKRKPKR